MLKRKLSPRELEVAELISRGLDHHEIAETLFISPKTVTNHSSNIKEKLGCRTSKEAKVLVTQCFERERSIVGLENRLNKIESLLERLIERHAQIGA